jgi:hypothetical protein
VNVETVMGVDTAGVRRLTPHILRWGVDNVFQLPQNLCCQCYHVMHAINNFVCFNSVFHICKLPFGSVFNTFSQLNSCLETYFLFSEML